eukprot:gene561-11864_t
MRIFNGHAYAEGLEFVPIDIERVLIVQRIDTYLQQEVNKCIKVYTGEGGSLVAYRTHDGAAVIDWDFHKRQRKLIQQYKLPPDSVSLMTSIFGIEFIRWINLNGFKPTTYYRDEIRAAAFECILWNKPLTPQQLANYDHVDRNDAFCSITYKTNEAYPYYKEYQIPQNCHHYRHNPPLEFCLSVSGIVVADIEVKDTAPPGIKKWFSNHSNKMYTTPFIKFCTEKKIIVVSKIYKVIWGTHKKLIQWNTEDHHLNRTFIGKCHQNSREDRYYMTDADHRAFHFHDLREKGILAREDGDVLIVPRPASHQYAEVRTFVMSYQAIAMFTILLKYGDNVAKVGCDDSWIKKGVFREPISEGERGQRIPGHWKYEHGKPYNFSQWGA